MEIRAARLDEGPVLGELMAASMRALGPSFYSPEATKSAATFFTVPDQGLIEDGTLYVAEIDGRLAGVGGWSSRRKLFAGSTEPLMGSERLDPLTEPARIRAFFVASEFTRRGVARRLYDVCAEAAREAGFRDFTLMASLPGVPFYRALGFGDEQPKRLILPDGSEVDGVEMRKSLIP